MTLIWKPPFRFIHPRTGNSNLEGWFRPTPFFPKPLSLYLFNPRPVMQKANCPPPLCPLFSFQASAQIASSPGPVATVSSPLFFSRPWGGLFYPPRRFRASTQGLWLGFFFFFPASLKMELLFDLFPFLRVRPRPAPEDFRNSFLSPFLPSSFSL